MAGVLAWERIRKDVESKPKAASGVDLRTACASGDTGRVSDLLRRGANTEVPDVFGRRPIHFAAEKGTRSLVLALITAGADVTAVCKAGDTALHKAALMGHTDAAVTLLLAGTPSHILDNEGQTAASVARARSHGALAEILEDRPWRIVNAAATGDPLVLAPLLRREGARGFGKPEVELANAVAVARVSKGQSALHVACACGRVETAHMLIEAGAELDVRQQGDGATPLELAQRAGHTAVVEMILGIKRAVIAKVTAPEGDGSDDSDAVVMKLPDESSDEEDDDGNVEDESVHSAISFATAGSRRATSPVRKLRSSGTNRTLLSPLSARSPSSAAKKDGQGRRSKGDAWSAKPPDGHPSSSASAATNIGSTTADDNAPLVLDVLVASATGLKLLAGDETLKMLAALTAHGEDVFGVNKGAGGALAETLVPVSKKRSAKLLAEPLIYCRATLTRNGRDVSASARDVGGVSETPPRAAATNIEWKGGGVVADAPRLTLSAKGGGGAKGGGLTGARLTGNNQEYFLKLEVRQTNVARLYDLAIGFADVPVVDFLPRGGGEESDPASRGGGESESDPDQRDVPLAITLRGSSVGANGMLALRGRLRTASGSRLPKVISASAAAAAARFQAATKRDKESKAALDSFTIRSVVAASSSSGASNTVPDGFTASFGAAAAAAFGSNGAARRGRRSFSSLEDLKVGAKSVDALPARRSFDGDDRLIRGLAASKVSRESRGSFDSSAAHVAPTDGELAIRSERKRRGSAFLRRIGAESLDNHGALLTATDDTRNTTVAGFVVSTEDAARFDAVLEHVSRTFAGTLLLVTKKHAMLEETARKNASRGSGTHPLRVASQLVAQLEALNRTVALAVVSLDERDEKARRAGNAAPHPAADNFELAVKTCGFLLGAILPRFNKLLSAIRHKKSLGSNTVTLLTDANNANGAGGGAVLSAARLEELDFTLAEVHEQMNALREYLEEKSIGQVALVALLAIRWRRRAAASAEARRQREGATGGKAANAAPDGSPVNVVTATAHVAQRRLSSNKLYGGIAEFAAAQKSAARPVAPTVVVPAAPRRSEQRHKSKQLQAMGMTVPGDLGK